jgi:hypothetical protein
MAGEVLELEARLKDFISGEINTIVGSLNKLSNKYSETATKHVKSTNVMSGAMTDLSNTWNIGKMALGGFVGALGAMEVLNKTIGFLRGARDEATEFNQLQLQLSASLGYTSRALNEQSEELSNKLVIDAEEITRVQTQISYFTKNEDQIKALTKAAMDYAAATGGSGMSLARAIEGSSRELQRYGININSTEGSLERINEIVDKVTARFGGQAEALAKSRDGFDRLGVTIRDIQEKMGRSTIFTVWSNGFNDLVRLWGSGVMQMLGETKKFEEENKKIIVQAKTDTENLLGSAQEFIMKQTHAGRLKLIEQQRQAELEKAIGIEQDGAQRLLAINDKYNILRKQENDKYYEDLKKKNDDLQKQEEARIKVVQDAMRAIAESEQIVRNERVSKGEENTRQLLAAHETLKTARIESIIDEDAREKLILKQRQEQELKELGDNEAAKTVLIKAHKQQLINLDAKKYQNEKKQDKDILLEKANVASSTADYMIGSLKQVAAASKASSTVQKGLDIAQATAATALAVTKSLSTPWMIPFILATGMAQVALITQQKYAGGGIVGGGSPSRGDVIPAMLTPGEMVLNGNQQSNLFNMLQRPNVSNSNSVNLNINVAQGGTYDMNAARYTVDQLVPVLGDALVKAKNEGRLRNYEAAR